MPTLLITPTAFDAVPNADLNSDAKAYQRVVVAPKPTDSAAVLVGK